MEGSKFARKYGKVARAAVSAALTGAMMFGAVTPALALTGTAEITISTSDVATKYKYYQLFTGDVNSEGTISNAAWPSDDNATRNVVVTFLTKDPSETGASVKYTTWLTDNGHEATDTTIAQYAAEYIASEIKASNGITVSGKQMTGTGTFANALAKAVVEGNVTAKGLGTPDGTKYTLTLDEGFYLVTDATSPNTVAPIWLPISSEKGQTAEPKTLPAALEKHAIEVVKQGNSNVEKDVKVVDASQGDIVKFKLAVTPASGQRYYRVTDTLPAGMSYVDGSLKMSQGNKSTLDAFKLASFESLLQTTLADSGDKLVITLPEAGPEYKTGSGTDEKTINPVLDGENDIILTYEAKVDEDATIGADALNTNKATLEFANNKDFDTAQTTNQVTASVASYELDLLKLDKTTAAGIQGVKFTIKNLDTGKFMKVSGGSQAVASAIDNSSEYADFLFETDKDGKIVAPRIDAGNYEITQITTKDDYEGMGAKKILVTIDATKDTDSGKVTAITASTTKLGNGTTNSFPITLVEELTSVEDGVVTIKVEDNKLIKLPITGMTPSQLGTIMGAVLVAAGAVALVARRRQGEQA